MLKAQRGLKFPCGPAVVFRGADRGGVTCSRRDRKDRVEIALEFPSISSPEIPKSCWRQFRVAHSVLDIPVAEVNLQGSGVVPLAARSRRHGAAGAEEP